MRKYIKLFEEAAVDQPLVKLPSRLTGIAEPDSTQVAKPDTRSSKYSCLPSSELAEAAAIAIQVHKIEPIFVRYAAGILGRESDYGKLIGKYLPTRYAAKAGFEFIFNSLPPSDPIRLGVQQLMKKIKGSDNWVPSMGIAQMTPDVAKKYGVNYQSLMTATGSLVAASMYLRDLYKELSPYYSDSEPSNIIINGRVQPNPSSSGNARLDAAISAYNLGSAKLAKNFCETSDSKYFAPCELPEYQPFPKDNPALKLKVNQFKKVPNYLPKFVTKTDQGEITSHGYVKEVVSRAKAFSCIA